MTAGLFGVVWITYFALTIYMLDTSVSLRSRQEQTSLPDLSTGPLGTPPAPIAREFAEISSCEADTKPGHPAPDLEPQISSYIRVSTDGAINSVFSDCGGLSGVYLEWFSADLAAGTIQLLGAQRAFERLREHGRRNRPDGFRVHAVSLLLLSELAAEDPEKHAQRIETTTEALKAVATENGVSTLCIMPETNNGGNAEVLREFLESLTARLSAASIRSCLVTGAADPFWHDPEIVAAVDRIVLQAFSIPEYGRGPAPLAPQGWFESTVTNAIDAIGPEKLAIALGNFGLLWREGATEPEIIGVSDAMQLAAENGGTIHLADESLNSYVSFEDSFGQAPEIWMLDATSFHNQLLWLQETGVSEVLLWSAGHEDPGLNSLLGSVGLLPSPTYEQDLVISNSVSYRGLGPFIRLAESSRAGHRTFQTDPNSGRINGQTYEKIPKPIVLERYGAKQEKLFALTFDDGPDAEFTTAILDILREERVPAAFFVIGSNVAREPEIARRIAMEGHELGSHTLFHPSAVHLSDYRLEFELDVSQRMLISATGRGTTLFRAPYGSSEGPATLEESHLLMRVQDYGYSVAGADIVVRDWEGLSASQIVDDVIARLESSGGSQVLILHDAGGNRQSTVSALPVLINRLRELGYRFVGLHELLDVERDELMPPHRGLMYQVDRASFALIHAAGTLFYWIFWSAILIGAFRSVAVLILAHIRRPHQFKPARSPEPVTVLIPALNEEASIGRCVTAVLASDHPHLSVIVIDDGSTDRTAEIVEAIARDDPRLLLIRQDNQGKWRALDTAYHLVDSEVVVAVDADTKLAPDAVSLMSRHFSDPSVGAVAGNVKVNNRSGLLTYLQALEYITAQNIDRRAAEVINGILVVPGAIGAWRVEAVRQAGFYVNDTITEDADLTIAVNRAGYRIVFEESAISFTDAPDRLGAFLRQRLRWVFGMMQTAWKHRGSALERRAVGLVAIPDLWLLGVGFGLLGPVADLVFLGLLVDGATNRFLGGSELFSNVQTWMIASYLALPALDLLAIFLALRFESPESKWLPLLLPFQRVLYRPLIYFTVYRAVANAAFGRTVGWGRPRQPIADQVS